MEVQGEQSSSNDGVELNSRKQSASSEDLERPAKVFGGENRNPNTAKSSSNSTVEGSEGKTPFPILQIITEKKEPEFIGYESNLPQILYLHQRFHGL